MLFMTLARAITACLVRKTLKTLSLNFDKHFDTSNIVVEEQIQHTSMLPGDTESSAASKVRSSSLLKVPKLNKCALHSTSSHARADSDSAPLHHGICSSVGILFSI